MNASWPTHNIVAAYKVASGGSPGGVDAAMHVPDGFLSPPVSIALWVLAAAIVGYALWRLNRDLDERKVPLMGVLAATIFAGQMLNFSVAGGTSGHLVGAALATILLGPWASIVVLTAVVSIQALLFQDGGLLALGANLFNMAVIGSAVAHAVYVLGMRLVGGKRLGNQFAAFAAAWSSIVMASLAVAIQLSASGTSPAGLALPAMGGIHMLIGIGEGLITVGALAFIGAARRDLIEREGKTKAGGDRGVIVGGAAIALVLAILSPIASTRPDGLEWVAERLGFLDTAQGPAYNLIPDYVVPGISSEALATVVASIIGAVVVFGVALLTARSRRRGETTG